MMVWFESIYSGLVTACLYLWLFIIPGAMAVIMWNRKKVNLAKCLLHILFFVYMYCVFAVVFLPLPTMENLPTTYSVQLIPGYFFYDIAKHFSVTNVAQTLFNIVMTIPFGAYLKYVWKMNLKKVLVFSLALSLLIEVGQLTGLFFLFKGSYRVCDVDDLICNTLGGVLGAVLTVKCTFLPVLEGFERVWSFDTVCRHA